MPAFAEPRVLGDSSCHVDVPLLPPPSAPGPSFPGPSHLAPLTPPFPPPAGGATRSAQVWRAVGREDGPSRLLGVALSTTDLAARPALLRHSGEV